MTAYPVSGNQSWRVAHSTRTQNPSNHKHFSVWVKHRLLQTYLPLLPINDRSMSIIDNMLYCDSCSSHRTVSRLYPIDNVFTLWWLNLPSICRNTIKNTGTWQIDELHLHRLCRRNYLLRTTECHWLIKLWRKSLLRLFVCPTEFVVHPRHLLVYIAVTNSSTFIPPSNPLA